MGLRATSFPGPGIRACWLLGGVGFWLAGRLGGIGWIRNDHHGVSHQAVPDHVALAQHRAHGLGIALGQVLHCLVDLRVERVALGAELLDALAGDDRAELVGKRLQRALL